MSTDKTNPDNVTERRELGTLIANLTGDDYVTTTEAAAVVEWCREWVADSFAQWDDEEQAFEESRLTPEALLRGCHRHIDGGLRFVLDDVRNVANARRAFEREHPEAKERREERARIYGRRASDDLVNDDKPTASERIRAARELSEHERYADCPACRQGLSWDGKTEHLEGCPDSIGDDETEPVYDVARVHSGTEDGYLWFVVRVDGLHAGELAGGGFWISEEAARMELDDFRRLAKLTPNERAAVETMRRESPAPGDYAAVAMIDDKPAEFVSRQECRDNPNARAANRRAVLTALLADWEGSSAIVLEDDGTRHADTVELARELERAAFDEPLTLPMDDDSAFVKLTDAQALTVDKLADGLSEVWGCIVRVDCVPDVTEAGSVLAIVTGDEFGSDPATRVWSSTGRTCARIRTARDYDSAVGMIRAEGLVPIVQRESSEVFTIAPGGTYSRRRFT